MSAHALQAEEKNWVDEAIDSLDGRRHWMMLSAHGRIKWGSAGWMDPAHSSNVHKSSKITLRAVASCSGHVVPKIDWKLLLQARPHKWLTNTYSCLLSFIYDVSYIKLLHLILFYRAAFWRSFILIFPVALLLFKGEINVNKTAWHITWLWKCTDSTLDG